MPAGPSGTSSNGGPFGGGALRAFEPGFGGEADQEVPVDIIDEEADAVDILYL